MSLLLLTIFVCLALSGLVWGVLQKGRYYQFPTLFCATWLLYFGPQAIGAVINSDKYPESLHRDYGLQLAFFFCILCIAGGLAGYAYGGTTRSKLFHLRSYSCGRLFLGGILLCIVGLWGAYELAQLSGGFVAQFTEGGYYGLEWQGDSVKYTFFERLVYPGFLLVFLTTLRRPSCFRWIIVCLCLAYPFAVAVFLGRRSMTAMLAVTILLGAFFVRHWAPPRPIFILLLVLAAAGIILAPAYRAKSQYGVDFQRLKEIDASGIVSSVFCGNQRGEFDVIVYGCAAVNRSLALNYGLDIYNVSVGALVPRQLVGEKLKNSLSVSFEPDFGTLLKRYYGWSIPYGSNPTGPFDAFRQLWFFGCLFYFVLGYVYSRLWAAAYSAENLGAQLWYILMAILIPQSVFGSITGLAPSILVILILFGPILYLAESPGCRQHTQLVGRLNGSSPRFSKSSSATPRSKLHAWPSQYIKC